MRYPGGKQVTYYLKYKGKHTRFKNVLDKKPRTWDSETPRVHAAMWHEGTQGWEPVCEQLRSTAKIGHGFPALTYDHRDPINVRYGDVMPEDCLQCKTMLSGPLKKRQVAKIAKAEAEVKRLKAGLDKLPVDAIWCRS